MKKLACLAALLALTACGEAATEEPVAEETAAVETETVAIALDGKPSVGTFTVTDADGKVGTFVSNADGTFTMTSADGETVTGTWTETEAGKFCETVEGKETCYTEAIDADGKWTSTGPDGKVSVIERVEG